jgi:hypothetical protein
MNGNGASLSTSPASNDRGLARFLPRIAISTIVAMIGGIALMQQAGKVAEQFKDPGSLISWWLLYAVCSALALSTKRDDALREVAAIALLPALVPVIQALIIQFITGVLAKLSGVPLTLKRAIVISVVDWIGIFLFSYGRQAILKAIEWASNPETKERLKTIEAVVRRLALLIGTLALIIAGKGYFSN